MAPARDTKPLFMLAKRVLNHNRYDWSGRVIIPIIISTRRFSV